MLPRRILGASGRKAALCEVTRKSGLDSASLVESSRGKSGRRRGGGSAGVEGEGG